MNTIVMILLMMGVGALIGGVTNSLAIKMLFRPFTAKYIGNMKVPFTPGLIPKRRQELADQLGKMVVEHLLTPEGLRKKLHDEAFQNQMVEWAQQEVSSMLKSDQSLKDWMSELDISVDRDQIHKSMYSFAHERYHQMMKNQRQKSIRTIIGPNWDHKGKEAMEQVSEYVLHNLEEYISSYEGRQKITNMIENYLEGQGFLANMVSSFIGTDGLAERIQPAVSDYLRSQDARLWLKRILEEEWEKWLNKPVRYYEDKLGADVTADMIATTVADALPVEEWLNRSVKDITEKYQTYVVDQFVPKLVHKSGDVLSDRIPDIMSKLHLSDVVKQEVESFSVERLERMVLDISRKEFKLITYLGALLGGIIGLIQAGIILMMG
ncbi:DUF445 domain-containing protein [Pontibacillus marinus]|uniref:Uncharacterized protein n=1 Tax=Pontibacillus marinus BH030004 = DSM 16465 TaxID=1385511 RepID=A0A0A5HR94_9BACI|nr:DUF445 family protein [Pontibacillus marinus]KGX86152.1 hypothetical protein N783_12590 [Pontibacillus marinus BH030004 = DSM 16465]